MKEISLHIMDIAQNSISANATRIKIIMHLSEAADTLTLLIEDNGKGMDEEMVKGVLSPFVTTRTTRRVGLGIPLLSAGAQATGGTFNIESELGNGTSVKAQYVLNHLDRPPIGDFSGTMHTLIICNPNIDFYVEFGDDNKENNLDTAEMRQVLGPEIALDTPDVSLWIKENLDELFPPEYAEI